MSYTGKQIKKKFPHVRFLRINDIKDDDIIYFDGKKLKILKKGEHLVAENLSLKRS